MTITQDNLNTAHDHILESLTAVENYLDGRPLLDGVSITSEELAASLAKGLVASITAHGEDVRQFIDGTRQVVGLLAAAPDDFLSAAAGILGSAPEVQS